VSDSITPLAAKSEAAIHQLNLSYSIEQDRLLFRVGLSDNTELMVWLTLRITKQLWLLLNGETHLPTANSIQIETPAAQAVEQFKQEVQATEALKKMDFATQYQPRKEVRNDSALLATALQLTDDGTKHLDITCIENINVRMNLTQELILAICNMLLLSSKEAGWDIGAPIATSLLIEVGEQKVLH
jgi:hypothetical protein